MLTAREVAIYALGKTEGVNSLAETLGKAWRMKNILNLGIKQ